MGPVRAVTPNLAGLPAGVGNPERLPIVEAALPLTAVLADLRRLGLFAWLPGGLAGGIVPSLPGNVLPLTDTAGRVVTNMIPQLAGGKAWKGNGVNSILSRPGDDPELDFSTGITLGGLFRRGVNGARHLVAHRYNTGAARAWYLFVYETGDVPTWQVSKTGGASAGELTSIVSSTPFYADGLFHLLEGSYAFVTDGTSIMYIFLDGVLVAVSSTAVGPLFNTSQAFQAFSAIGAWPLRGEGSLVYVGGSPSSLADHQRRYALLGGTSPGVRSGSLGIAPAALLFSEDYNHATDPLYSRTGVKRAGGAHTAIESGQLVITPTLDGTEMIVDGGFPNLTNWPTLGTPTTVEVAGGQLHVVADANGEGVYQDNVVGAASTWYQLVFTLTIVSGVFRISWSDAGDILDRNTPVTAYTYYPTVLGAPAASNIVSLRSLVGAAEYSVDDVSLQKINLSTMMDLVPITERYVALRPSGVYSTFRQMGCIYYVDANNYVVAINHTLSSGAVIQARLVSVIDGVTTVHGAATITWASGQLPHLIRTPLGFRVEYNGVTVIGHTEINIGDPTGVGPFNSRSSATARFDHFIVEAAPEIDYEEEVLALEPAAWYAADHQDFYDGQAVSTVADSSGNGKTATQSTGSAMPTFKRDIINGKPVFCFDGGDYLTAGTGWNLDAYTVFAVVRFTNTIDDMNDRNGVFALASGVNDRLFLMSGGFAASDRLYGALNQAVGGEISAYATNITAGTPVVLCLQCSSTGTQLFVNGTAQSLSNNDAAPPLTAEAELRLGARYGTAFQDLLNGDIAEFMIVPEDLAADERNMVTTYLQTKYGVS